jgi:hypothetical protein
MVMEAAQRMMPAYTSSWTADFLSDELEAEEPATTVMNEKDESSNIDVETEEPTKSLMNATVLKVVAKQDARITVSENAIEIEFAGRN